MTQTSLRDRQHNYFNLARNNLCRARVAEPVDPISNGEGLRRVYREPHIFSSHAQVLHIAGTQMGRLCTTSHDKQPWGDAVEDTWNAVTKTPFHLTEQSLRYKEARDVLTNTPNTTCLNDHSLGGAVALHLQKDMSKRNFTVGTYGAPAASVKQRETRFRNPWDFISI